VVSYNQINNGWQITYDNGDGDGCRENRKTIVTMACDLDAGVGVLQFVSSDDGTGSGSGSNSNCVINLALTTSHVCLVCSTDDFNLHQGVCNGGERINTYTKKDDAMCLGGMPADVIEKCSAISMDTSTILLISLVVILGFAGLVYLYMHQKKKLDVAYQRLSTKDNDMFEL